MAINPQWVRCGIAATQSCLLVACGSYVPTPILSIVEPRVTYYPTATPAQQASPTMFSTSASPMREATPMSAMPSVTPALPTIAPSRTAQPTPRQMAILPTQMVASTPSPVPSSVAFSAQTHEGTLEIDSYGWRNALVPSATGDPIYPYPHLDFGRVGGVERVAIKVVILENATARITICPDLGGRILRWYDKRAGREVLYANSVLKPTHWGYRGWWLATGGIEWAFPTNEHGLNEWRPWRYTITSNASGPGVVVYDRESKTGLDVAVGIRLMADGSISLSPRVNNTTGKAQTFQFWVNAMLPYSPEARFALPATRVLVHSTGDGSLPQPYQPMSWPVFNGRDFSRASEWRNYLGVFAESLIGGSAAVSYADGSRVVRSFPAQIAKGVKLFLLGDLSANLYTDDDSRYLEMWGGLTRTFDESAVIEPGAQIGWTETWQVTPPK